MIFCCSFYEKMQLHAVKIRKSNALANSSQSASCYFFCFFLFETQINNFDEINNKCSLCSLSRLYFEIFSRSTNAGFWFKFDFFFFSTVLLIIDYGKINTIVQNKMKMQVKIQNCCNILILIYIKMNWIWLIRAYDSLNIFLSFKLVF